MCILYTLVGNERHDCHFDQSAFGIVSMRTLASRFYSKRHFKKTRSTLFVYPLHFDFRFLFYSLTTIIATSSTERVSVIDSLMACFIGNVKKKSIEDLMSLAHTWHSTWSSYFFVACSFMYSIQFECGNVMKYSFDGCVAHCSVYNNIHTFQAQSTSFYTFIFCICNIQLQFACHSSFVPFYFDGVKTFFLVNEPHFQRMAFSHKRKSSEKFQTSEKHFDFHTAKRIDSYSQSVIVSYFVSTKYFRLKKFKLKNKYFKLK